MEGRNTAVERLRRRFLLVFLEARRLEAGGVWGWLGLPISTTVGGRSWRWKAAGSGRAASTITLVSGRWAPAAAGKQFQTLTLVLPQLLV